jgi:hypothetical protein
MTNTQLSKENFKEKEKSITGPRWAPDCRSQTNFNLNFNPLVREGATNDKPATVWWKFQGERKIGHGSQMTPRQTGRLTVGCKLISTSIKDRRNFTFSLFCLYFIIFQLSRNAMCHDLMKSIDYHEIEADFWFDVFPLQKSWTRFPGVYSRFWQRAKPIK